MSTGSRLVVAGGCSAILALGGCYVVPAIGPDGQPVYYHYPIPPSGPVVHGVPPASSLQARLYPANDMAHRSGMLTGTVTNVVAGKGLFQINYRGEVLSGEATRMSNDERKGIASAYGPSGAYMNCEYQMHSPQQGAGTCTFSDGAKYQVHLGN